MSNLHQQLATGLDKILNAEGPRKNGFVLLTFPLDQAEGQRVNYVSNAHRADMLTALKEIVARFGGQPEQSGTA